MDSNKEILVKVETLKNILVGRATGSYSDNTNDEYVELRRELGADGAVLLHFRRRGRRSKEEAPARDRLARNGYGNAGRVCAPRLYQDQTYIYRARTVEPQGSTRRCCAFQEQVLFGLEDAR